MSQRRRLRVAAGRTPRTKQRKATMTIAEPPITYSPHSFAPVDPELLVAVYAVNGHRVYQRVAGWLVEVEWAAYDRTGALRLTGRRRIIAARIDERGELVPVDRVDGERDPDYQGVEWTAQLPENTQELLPQP